MTPAEAALLGVVQGLTEFLPVSSSGHLQIAKHAAGVQGADLLFDLVTHVGTLLAVFVYYRRDITDITLGWLRGIADLPRAGAAEVLARPPVWLGTAVIAATIPTGVIGVVFKKPLEAMFTNIGLIGCALWLTALLLTASSLYERRRGEAGAPPAPLTLGRALLVGLVQGAAITPGLSRSGATISAGLFVGLTRADAARFSFLMSIPAILGAVVLKAKDAIEEGVVIDAPALGVGFVVSAVVGYFALDLLVRVVVRGRWAVFAPYVAVLGTYAVYEGFVR